MILMRFCLRNSKQMLKRALCLLIIAFSLPALPADARTARTAPAVLLKKVPRGYVLSVDVRDEPLEKLLRTVCTQCGIHIALRGENHRLNSVSIHFKDLPLEQAIRKLIKASGINNYLIRCSGTDNSPQSITEVMIFGNGTMTGAAFSDAETVPGEKPYEMSEDLKPTAAAPDKYSQKIASFKDRYLWEDEETSTWAIYLLEAMPEEAKDFGLDGIIKELDKNSGPERTVPLNAALFYRAIEAAAPPDIVPVMMHQVRRLSEHYHNSRAQEKADMSRDEFQHNLVSEEGRQGS